MLFFHHMHFDFSHVLDYHQLLQHSRFITLIYNKMAILFEHVIERPARTTFVVRLCSSQESQLDNDRIIYIDNGRYKFLVPLSSKAYLTQVPYNRYTYK